VRAVRRLSDEGESCVCGQSNDRVEVFRPVLQRMESFAEAMLEFAQLGRAIGPH